MTYPNAVPHVPVIECLDGTSNREWTQQVQQSEAYKFRTPKGWTSSAGKQSVKIIQIPFAQILETLENETKNVVENFCVLNC